MASKKKGNSLNNLGKEKEKEKEKISKTPQPTNNNKNVPAKREHDPADSFQLWIPEPLENLEVQIHSKKRILEILQEKTENLDEDIKHAMLVRDQQINSLNKTILGLRSELKAKEDLLKQNDHSSRISALQRELTELHEEKEQYDDNIQRMKDEFESNQANWYDEKDSLMLQQEAVVEEQQGLIAKLHSKENEIKSVREDILQVSKIVNEMTAINHDLQKKVENLNELIEDYRRKFFLIQAKAEIIEELEVKYTESINERKILYEQYHENAKEIAIFKEHYFSNFTNGIEKLAQLLLDFKPITQKNDSHNDNSDIKYFKLADHIELLNTICKEINILAKNIITSPNNISQLVDPTKLILTEIKVKEVEYKEKQMLIKTNEMNAGVDKMRKDFINMSNNTKKVIDNLN